MKQQSLTDFLLYYKKRTSVIKAMAHPARLFMLEQLRNGEFCVCELAEMVEADVSTVSKHLALLKSAGLVRDRKAGLQVFYSLRCPCVLDFMGCIEAVLAEDGKDLREARRRRA
jgi:DNA-binding transcriptional ArsR family regulator